jgi:quinol monooxygenase YgiN
VVAKLSGCCGKISINVPAKPWKAFGSPKRESDCVALLSYLPLKSHMRLLPFVYYTAQIINQLSAAPGLLGYSLLARPASKKFWTLSAWESDTALDTFVRHPPHVRIMVALAPYMAKTEFVRWRVKGAELPLKWDDALARFRSRSSV